MNKEIMDTVSIAEGIIINKLSSHADIITAASILKHNLEIRSILDFLEKRGVFK